MSDPANDSKPQDAARESATKLAIGTGHLRRHIFLCTGKPTPSADALAANPNAGGCCGCDAGLASWNHLKKRLADLGLANPKGEVARTKADCLRVCAEGPIGVVYPDGIWYRSLTPANLDRVVEQHLRDSRVVEDLVIAIDPLRA
ncbi:MAG: hypothetical protein QM770_14135 [Tepidisphaeraceae bacterium]